MHLTYSESDCTTILFLLRGGFIGEFSPSNTIVAAFAADFFALSSVLRLRLVLAGVAAGLFFNANGVLES